MGRFKIHIKPDGSGWDTFGLIMGIIMLAALAWMVITIFLPGGYIDYIKSLK
jgi:hypothetical protein